MPGGTEVARAYVTIVAKSDGNAGKAIADAAKGATKGMESEGAKAGERAGRGFSKSFASFASGAAKKAGIALAAGIGLGTVAMGGFAKSSLDAGKQFDASMSQVAATMGKSVDEIGDLRDFAREMGSKTAFSASEAADALNYMALAGYDSKTSMQMLPNVLNLAAAGNMDLATASDMVTDTQSALGLSIEETTQLVDKMAAASSTTNTSVAQLGSALLTVGGTAKSLSGGTTEAAQALGLLADNGIKGSEGGTALRNVLLGLSSDKFEKTFGKLGVSAYDAEGNMRSLKDIFGDMNTAMKDMTVEEKTEALSSAFNKVDLKSLNALLGTSAERWDEVAAAIDNSAGAAERMADTQLDNLEGDITIFKSALEGVKLSFSDAIMPAMRDFVQTGTDGLGRLTGILESDAFASFADRLADGFDHAAAFLEGFLDVLLPVDEALESAFGSGGAAAGGLGVITDALDIAADAGNEFTDMLSTTVGALQDGFGEAALQPARDFGGSVASVFRDAVVAVKDFVGALTETVDVEGFESAFTGVADAIGGAFGDGGDAASARDFGTAFGNALNGAIPVIEAATPVIGAIAGVISFLADNATVAFPVMVGLGAAFMLIQGASKVQGFLSTVSALLPAIGAGGGAAGAGLGTTAAGEEAAGAAAASSAKNLMQVGVAVLALGGGIMLAAAGMFILAQAAISIADAGPGAGQAMLAMVGGIAALGAGAAAAGAAMTAGAVGILAFGAAVLLVGVGVLLACAGITLLATQLPTIAAYGAAAGSAAMVLGTGLLVVGAGAIVAGAGAIVLGAGLVVAAAGLTLVAGAVALASGGVTMLGGALQIVASAVEKVGNGAMNMGTGLQAAGNAMPVIAASAGAAGIGIGELAAAMALAGGKLQDGSQAMANAGDGAAKLAQGVMVAADGAMLAAAGFAQMAMAATAGTNMVRSGIGTIPKAVTSAATAVTSLSSRICSAMSQAASSTTSAAASIRNSINGIQGKTVRVNVARGSVVLPHFSMSGNFDPKTKAVPTVGVSWYAKGGIFAANTPTIIGVGDAREPEAVQPLSHLQSLLDMSGGGGDTYNINVTAGGDAREIADTIVRQIRAYGLVHGRA